MTRECHTRKDREGVWRSLVILLPSSRKGLQSDRFGIVLSVYFLSNLPNWLLSKMWRVLSVVVLGCLATTINAAECQHSRRGGLLLNYYQDQTNGNFFGQTSYVNTGSGPGGTNTYTLTNNFNVLGASGNTVIVNDEGKMLFWFDNGSALYRDDLSQAEYNTYAGTTSDPRISYDRYQAYAAARWYVDTAGYEYRFASQHILRSNIVVGGNVVASLCQLERIEAIIDDCAGSHYDTNVPNYGTTTVVEAVILTTQLTRTSDSANEYTQTVLAITSTGATKIIFLYENNTPFILDSVKGYINGRYDTVTVQADSLWMGICDTGSGLGTNSNCDCGGHNQGVYVFDTADVPQASEATTQNKECQGVFSSACATGSLPHYLRNRYCRPKIVPTSTCREDLTCEAYTVNTNTFRMTITFRDAPPYDEAVFIDDTAWEGSQTVTAYAADSNCIQTIGNDRKLVFDFNPTQATACGINVNAPSGAVDFHILLRDPSDTQYFKDGYRIIGGDCQFTDLPETVDVSPAFGEVPTTVRPVAARSVDFFVSSEYNYKTNPNTDVSGTTLYLGQDLFLVAGYEAASIQENAEAYGIWLSDCYVSNSALFPADVNTVQIVNANGCRSQTNPNTFFYMQQEIKSTNAGVGNTYEWVVSSGKFDAQRWINDDDLYFKCTVNFCYNQVVRDNDLSKCEDSCNGVTDANAGRRKRDTYPVTSNETMVVETRVQIKASLPPQASTGGLSGCADNGTVIPVIVVLFVLLLIVGVLTAVMFYKLHSRMRKRI